VKQEAAPTAPPDVDDGIHIIVSTGCNVFQHWQMELLLYSHKRSGQKGKITRLVSGCEESREVKSMAHLTHPGGKLHDIVGRDVLERSTHPDFGLHITPAFEGAKEFPWFNKPLSIDHWAKHGNHEGASVVVIMDPDEIILEAITQHELSTGKGLLGSNTNGANVVKPGTPVAQMYGIGSSWFRMPRDEICGQGSECAKTGHQVAQQHFAVGPPYLIHMSDFPALAGKWAEYIRPVAKYAKGDILTDMWAYCMAAANLGLKHTQLHQYMVSNPGIGGEGWPLLDQWPASHWDSIDCNQPSVPEGSHMPNVVHFAQNYHTTDAKGRKWMWHKGHVPGDLLECDVPLLKQPPANFIAKQQNKKDRQHAWLICMLLSNVNEMATAYKGKFCKQGQTVNLEKKIKLVQNKDRHCNVGRDKLCWPLAQLEEELDAAETRMR